MPLSGPPAWARDPDVPGGFAPTMIQFPTRPVNERTMERREETILATYTGRVRDAIDLWRQLTTEDGWQSGLLGTMGHGLLGMPIAFQGDPAMCSALLDADGTIGEYGAMHPENEAAQILIDGIATNMGLGQYIFDAEDLDRPLGTHRIPRLVWRDPRWLRRDPYSLQWYFLGRDGEIAIKPGDGEWLLFQPYPDADTWRHGPWIYMTLAAIFARDAIFDRQRVSEVCAPTRIARAMKPTTPQARKKMASEIARMAHDNQITLSQEWIYEIICATAGDYWKVCAEIATWARQMVEVGLTGNILSIEGPTGFSNADIYRRVTDSRRRFYANAWTRCVREQGLTWWVRDNYGPAAVARCPVPVYNVESPEDAVARAGALKAWGDGIKACADGIAAAGVQLVPAYVLEVLQRAGIRAEQKPATSVPVAKLDLGVDAISALIMGQEGRASQGLPPFGDERDRMIIAALLESAKPGAAALGGPKLPPPAPGEAPPLAGPPSPGPAPPAPPGDDSGPAAGHEDAARFAAEMSSAQYDRCPHGRTHTCDRCGIQRVYSVAQGKPGAGPSFGIAWRPIAGAPAPVDPTPLARLGARTDASGHEHADDGKFGSGSGGHHEGGEHHKPTPKHEEKKEDKPEPKKEPESEKHEEPKAPEKKDASPATPGAPTPRGVITHEQLTAGGETHYKVPGGSVTVPVNRRELKPDADGKMVATGKMEPNIHHVDEQAEKVSGVKAVVYVHGAPGEPLKRMDLYDDAHEQRKRDYKFGKAIKLNEHIDELRGNIDKGFASTDPKERAAATVSKLIDSHYIRMGGSDAEEKTGSRGASTLEAQHVHDLGKGGVQLDFPGKSGHHWTVNVTDPALAQRLREYSAGKQPGEKLFGVSPQDVNGFLEKSSPSLKVTAKDFRTFHANRILFDALSKSPPAATKKDVEANVNAAVLRTANLLGHTPAVSKSEYMNPSIINQYVDAHEHLPAAPPKPGKKAK